MIAENRRYRASSPSSPSSREIGKAEAYRGSTRMGADQKNFLPPMNTDFTDQENLVIAETALNPEPHLQPTHGDTEGRRR
jgi:hypothetical protein